MRKSTVTEDRAQEPGIDRLAAEEAFRSFLAAFGMKDDAEVMANTPRRVVDAYIELFTAPRYDPTAFSNEEQYDEIVLLREIPFRSVCEHHFLPFVGVAHVGYLPGSEVIGLSKLARVVEACARRPQRQERLTVQIGQRLEEELEPYGVAVLVAARHACMTLRGARAGSATTVTSSFRGALAEPSRRAEFMALLNLTVPGRASTA